MKLLHQLDQAQALKFGIIKSTDIKRDPGPGVSLVEGRRLYEHFVAQARAAHPVVQTGQFAADMKVALVNDGPITIPIRISA